MISFQKRQLYSENKETQGGESEPKGDVKQEVSLLERE